MYQPLVGHHVWDGEVASRRSSFGMTSGELSVESGRQRVTWKVPDFFQLQLDCTESPKIYFGDDCYRLQLYPFGAWGYIRRDTVCIALERSSVLELRLPRTVSCELRLMSRTLKEIELKSHSSRCSSREIFCIERRELEENRYLYVPDGTLTLICYMSWGKPSSAGGAHFEDQQGLPGVTKLQSDYRQLLQKGAESDACLVVSGKEFRAHKNILRARSPVFDAMFRHETIEKTTGHIVIDDLDPEIFGDFLEYLYTGGIAAGLSKFNVFGLYAAADKYDVPTLKSECVAHMRRNLTVGSFCDVMTVALRHSEEDLQEEAARFFKEYVARIIATPKWEQFVIDNGASASELLIKASVPGEQ